jgi:uncharacterized membrane protein YhaH (DUF805 family)/uncharacterized membrane protein YphA (DoxX/SURF4 family)
MKYGAWFVRLIFAAWMIPAGVNHFVSIFPQPMGSQPLSQEMIVALIDSHLFDLVKAVELVAGLFVLIGFHAALGVLICVPVSFCVFWWDAPLEGFGSRAARFGNATLISNLLLCIAFVGSYRPMFAVRPPAGSLVLAGRVILGIWMLANGVNYFLLHLWALPAGHEPLAVQLITAFEHSGLLTVAMVIQTVTGVLLLAGLFVPAALCVLMPVSTCTLYWSLVLEHRPLVALLALLAFALNGLLMLACLDRYRGVLQRHATTLGESPGGNVFDALFASPGGRTSRSEFIPALVTLLLAVAFYAYFVKNRTGTFCLLVLLYPALVLLARRLRDMQQTPWLLVVPGMLMVGTFAIWLKYLDPGESVASVLPVAAIAVLAGFGLWGSVGRSGARTLPAA